MNWTHPEQGLLTPLHAASASGHLSVVNALIAARAVVDRVNVQGFTALMYAAQQGHEAIVSVLHRVAAASVHHVNNQGFTAMHMAAKNGHVGVVRVLLRARDYPNVVSTDGSRSSPLELASVCSHPAAVQALIEGGANVNYSRPDGVTSLMLAAQLGHIEVVRALLAAGANVNQANTQGATALMVAAQNGHIEVVRALLAVNSDPRIVTYNGNTALSLAKAKNHPAIAALLEARLAELAAAGSARMIVRARERGRDIGRSRDCCFCDGLYKLTAATGLYEPIPCTQSLRPRFLGEPRLQGCWE